MRFDSPLGPARLIAPAVSETWLLGYFLFAAVSETAQRVEPDIPVTVWAIRIVLRSAGAVVFNGILWFYLASVTLGAIASMSSSIRIVGNAFFRPAVALSVLYFVILLFRLRAPWQDYGQLTQLMQLMQLMRLILILWAFVNVVRAAKRTNSFGAAQVVLFVLWGCGVGVVKGFYFR